MIRVLAGVTLIPVGLLACAIVRMVVLRLVCWQLGHDEMVPVGPFWPVWRRCERCGRWDRR